MECPWWAWPYTTQKGSNDLKGSSGAVPAPMLPLCHARAGTESNSVGTTPRTSSGVPEEADELLVRVGNVEREARFDVRGLRRHLDAHADLCR